MACRVRRACEAWSASVREIYRGNAKQRELRGVAPGWQPGAPKQDLGVSVHGGAQKASGLWGSVAETLHGMSTLRYASA